MLTTGASAIAEAATGGRQDRAGALAGGHQPAPQERRGDDRLEAARPPAGAPLAAVVDDDVADLAGGEAVAEDEVPVDDDPGADTVADLDEQEAGDRSRRRR